ncbi:unnamed protein product [Laminaria digitata]
MYAYDEYSATKRGIQGSSSVQELRQSESFQPKNSTPILARIKSDADSSLPGGRYPQLWPRVSLILPISQPCVAQRRQHREKHSPSASCTPPIDQSSRHKGVVGGVPEPQAANSRC